MPFQIAEEVGIQNDPVLHHFGQAREVFALGQGGQHARVDEHAARLPEGPHHVFRARQIDPHLAADRAVDLRKQRGGDLNEGQPSGERRRDESRQITDHTAPHGNDNRTSIGADFEQFLPQDVGRGDTFGGLARLDRKNIHVGVFGQALGHGATVRLDNVFIGHEGHVRRRDALLDKAANVDQVARANFDRVSAFGKDDLDNGCRTAHASTPRWVAPPLPAKRWRAGRRRAGLEYHCRPGVKGCPGQGLHAHRCKEQASQGYFKRSTSAGVTVIWRQKPVCRRR